MLDALSGPWKDEYENVEFREMQPNDVLTAIILILGVASHSDKRFLPIGTKVLSLVEEFGEKNDYKFLF